jgi:hypothetical protein
MCSPLARALLADAVVVTDRRRSRSPPPLAGKGAKKPATVHAFYCGGKTCTGAPRSGKQHPYIHNPSSAPIEFNQPLSIHNLLDTWYTEHLVKWKDLELLILGRNDFSQGFNETLVI